MAAGLAASTVADAAAAAVGVESAIGGAESVRAAGHRKAEGCRAIGRSLAAALAAGSVARKSAAAVAVLRAARPARSAIGRTDDGIADVARAAVALVRPK